MPYTIDKEAESYSLSTFNIENMCDRYKTDNLFFSFPSPTLATIEKHLFFLLKYSTVKVFESKYRYRPDYLSFDEYGTVVLWEFLMFINQVPSLEDFDIPEVVIPSLEAIITMTRSNFPKKPVDRLQEINW